MTNRSRNAKARKILKELEVHQDWLAARGFTWGIFFLLVVSGGLVILDIFDWIPLETRFFATPIATIGALFIALHQWKHLRNEVSLTGSLARLDLVNDYFKKEEYYSTVIHYYGNLPLPWAPQINPKEKEKWQHLMYVFIELDNLQYGVEKYRLGHSSPFQCLRVIDVFAARCMSKKFHEVAKSLINERAGSYTPETRRVVDSLRSGDRFMGSEGPKVLPGTEIKVV